jgi:phosphatidylserine decarboxylase
MDLTLTLIAALLGLLALTAASWKWSLPASRVTWILAAATLLGVLAGWGLQRQETAPWIVAVAIWAIQGATYVGIIAWLFYRDPERDVPKEAGLLVSPADGRVIYVRRLEAGEPLRCDKNGAAMVLDEVKGTGLEHEALWQVGVSMVFTDVHVNRAPIAGKVSLVHHRPGKFLSLRLKEALNVNERQTLVIDNGEFQIGLVQIASRLVRRIVAYVSPNQQLQIGQRVGMIKFGSQVDLFVPVRVAPRLEVSEGQRLTAGETIVCRVSAPKRELHVAAGPAENSRR